MFHTKMELFGARDEDVGLWNGENGNGGELGTIRGMMDTIRSW